MFGNNEIIQSKIGKRIGMGVCTHCGHNPCTCKIPKATAKKLPKGISRRGTRGKGHPLSTEISTPQMWEIQRQIRNKNKRAK
jgi:hypothetical protein